MKLIVEIEGEKRELEVRRDGERVVAEVANGRHYEIETHSTQPGIYLLLSEGRVYECRVSRQGTRHEAAAVTVGSRSYAAALTDPKRLRGAQHAGAKTDGTARILAPMPGKVVRVL
ncbi:MAG TPA: hypothetical protein VEV81_15435, partial [Pyrinomonadaceae bacterium]|nr:hypothetical protein [Pyrinomonadaceae bacterium]